MRAGHPIPHSRCFFMGPSIPQWRGGGFVFGLGSSGWKEAVRACLAAALGAVLGSIVYDVFQTIAFPLAWDFSPMPGTAGSRLLAHLSMSVCAISCVVTSVGRRNEPAHRAASPSNTRSNTTLSKR